MTSRRVVLRSPIPTPKKAAVAENLSQLERAIMPGKVNMPVRVMRNGFFMSRYKATANEPITAASSQINSTARVRVNPARTNR